MRAEIGVFVFMLVNVYAPNRGCDRVRFFQKLVQKLQNNDTNEILILGGDWNCTVDFTQERTSEKLHPWSEHALERVVTFWMSGGGRMQMLGNIHG